MFIQQNFKTVSLRIFMPVIFIKSTVCDSVDVFHDSVDIAGVNSIEVWTPQV